VILIRFGITIKVSAKGKRVRKTDGSIYAPCFSSESSSSEKSREKNNRT